MKHKLCVRLLVSVVMVLSASFVFAAAMDSLTVGIAADAKSLDPQQATDTASFNIIKQINEPLVTVDGKTKQLVPVLAERWDVLDSETYKFYLRKGVKFHNGMEMTAEDVLFSLKNVATKSIHATSTGKYIDPDGFKIIDKYTIVVKTKGPVGFFLESMKHPYASILCKSAVEKAGADYFRNPVGTGPFRFKNWIKGEKIELTAFADYYGKKPEYKNLTFLVIPDDSSRVIALETKKVDIIYAVPPSDYDRLSGSSKVKVVMGPGLRLLYLGMNTQKKPLEDPRVRLAIIYAINRDAYSQVVYQGRAVVPVGPLVPASSFSPINAKPYPYDLAKAKSLLAAAGYPNGFTVNLWSGNLQDVVNGATILQSMLAQVGIKVNVQVFDNAAFNTKMTGSDHDLYISQWGMQTVREAGNWWNSLFHSTSIGTVNWARLNDALIDTEINQAMTSVDQKARIVHLQKVWDRLVELTPIVPLVVPTELYGVRKEIVGVEDFCDGQINSFVNITSN